jgi:urease subunit alpha
MGDPNASIPTPQPMIYRPQFAAHGRAKYSTSLTFVSDAALRSGGLASLELQKSLSAVKNTRKVTKHHLLWNDTLPKIEVDPETYTVKADGRVLTCEPASVLPLAQRYFLF